MIRIIFLLAFFSMSIISVEAQNNDRIIINKKPRTTNQPQKQQYPQTNQQQKTNPFPNSTQNRVQHENVQQLENLELRYTAKKIGSNSKHNFYRIVGHIYSNLNEPLFCHNRRIVMFQIDNWDSGFLNDNLQSIDGYATNQVLKQGGALYQFGNSNVREFQFDFKVKLGRQPYIKSEIIKDWRVMEDYEQYLVMDYAAMSGNWVGQNNPETKFAVQFSPQGDQIVMTDLLKNQIGWIKADETRYVRNINVNPSTATNATNNNSQYPSQNKTQPKTSDSTYPSGGYLGNGNGNNNSNNNNNNNSNNNNNNNTYPSGGYLGNGNGGSSNNPNGNAAGQNVESYSSLITIVDRNTLKYQNSEGIVVTLVRGTN